MLRPWRHGRRLLIQEPAKRRLTAPGQSEIRLKKLVPPAISRKELGARAPQDDTGRIERLDRREAGGRILEALAAPRIGGDEFGQTTDTQRTVDGRQELRNPSPGTIDQKQVEATVGLAQLIAIGVKKHPLPRVEPLLVVVVNKPNPLGSAQRSQRTLCLRFARIPKDEDVHAYRE